MNVMHTVEMTYLFSKWMDDLRDLTARDRVLARIILVQRGNIGKTNRVGGGVFELKINYGPGYRLYFINKAGKIILLLCGGDKNSQKRDIKLAIELAKQEV